MLKLLMEAIAVGLVTILIGYLVNFVTPQSLSQPLYLFIVGASIHLTCEVLGINKYYCKKGNACITE